MRSANDGVHGGLELASILFKLKEKKICCAYSSLIDYLIFFVTSLGLHFSRKRAAVSPRTRGTLSAPWRSQNSFKTISECFMGESLTALWHSSMTKSAIWPTVMKPWLTALTKSWAVITKTLFFSNSFAHLEIGFKSSAVAFGFFKLYKCRCCLFEISETCRPSTSRRRALRNIRPLPDRCAGGCRRPAAWPEWRWAPEKRRAVHLAPTAWNIWSVQELNRIPYIH